MRKLHLLVALLTIPLTTLFAGDAQFDVSVSTSLRQDRLKWHISGPQKKPNVLSELTFKHVRMRPYTLSLKFSKNSYFAEASGSYGEITSGKVRDSDYFMKNRHLEYSRSYSHVTGSYMCDATFLAGKKFTFDSQWEGSLLGGFTLLQERFRMKHGVQKKMLNLYEMNIVRTNHKIHHLNSTYKSRWDGPFIGVSTRFRVTDKFSLHALYNFLFCVQYKGCGFWNLRQAMFDGDFHQRSKRQKGYGNVISAGASYSIFQGLDLFVDGTYMALRAKGGHDSVHTRIRQRKITVPFGRASLDSASCRFGVLCKF